MTADIGQTHRPCQPIVVNRRERQAVTPAPIATSPFPNSASAADGNNNPADLLDERRTCTGLKRSSLVSTCGEAGVFSSR